ncbi:hypothetical protein U1Q18_005516 [Sarracenia purpurea var. burkii]
MPNPTTRGTTKLTGRRPMKAPRPKTKEEEATTTRDTIEGEEITKGNIDETTKREPRRRDGTDTSNNDHRSDDQIHPRCDRREGG